MYTTTSTQATRKRGATQFQGCLASLTLVLAMNTHACSTGQHSGPDDSEADADDTVQPVSETPTYYKDVHPILQTRCAGCHHKGGIGPLSFDDDPANARAVAPLIASTTAERKMPPFLPGELTPPLRGEARLSDQEIATLRAWAEADAPLGDPADQSPIAPTSAFPLNEPELEFDIGTDYTPDPELSDDYHCFATPLAVSAPRVLIGFRVIPGSPRVVHHVSVGLLSADDAQAISDLDARTPDRAGWPCFGNLIPVDSGIRPAGGIGTWVPGVDGQLLYPGTGKPIPSDVIAVIQVHYNTLNGPDQDRTRVQVFFAPQETQAQLLPLGSTGVAAADLSIPADRQETTVTGVRMVGQLPPDNPQTTLARMVPAGDRWAVGVYAHGHLLMTRFRLTLNAGAPDAQILLDIPRWDFHWQGNWLYQTPIRLRPTDRLTVQCTYDNSPEYRAQVGLPAASTVVTWGEGTTDEMCIGNVALVSEEPRQ